MRIVLPVSVSTYHLLSFAIEEPVQKHQAKHNVQHQEDIDELVIEDYAVVNLFKINSEKI